MKSGSEASFYLPAGGSDRFASTSATAGPWGPTAQHAGPPSALLSRALEGLLEPDRTIGRISIDLLGAVPVGPLAVSTSVVRPGRTVSLMTASLYDEAAGRECATARAWALPRSATGPAESEPLPHGPADGATQPAPGSWSRGYLDAVEWTWVKGSMLDGEPATVWMRPLLPLLPGEPLVGVPLLMALVDSASGISAGLDPDEWSFMNTDLSVNVLREPVGEWICLDAETTLTASAAGVTTATAYDERGIVARSAQTLLVLPRV
jgi:acyl-CoA thioesterase